MFEQSHCELEELIDEYPAKITKFIIPSENYQETIQKIYGTDFDKETMFRYKIIRTFEFSSERKKASCIIYNPISNKYKIIIKGVPKIIAKHCLEETLPYEFTECLETYQKDGLRIIGLAAREISKEDINLSE